MQDAKYHRKNEEVVQIIEQIPVLAPAALDPEQEHHQHCEPRNLAIEVVQAHVVVLDLLLLLRWRSQIASRQRCRRVTGRSGRLD